MATRPRRKSDSASKISLVKALAFAESILKSDRDFRQQHCYIGRGMLVAFDGTLAAGHPIVEDIEGVPHSGKLLKALERSDETVSVTLNDTQRISVKAGKFRAVINCIPVGEFYSPTGDAPIAAINDKLRDGFKTIMHLASETADKMHFASILLQANSMFATNGKTCLEYWHGIDLPEMSLPKQAAQAIVKTDKKLTRFGYSGHSATFHFEDGSWIRTQLFADRWPDAAALFRSQTRPGPVPPTLFAAVRAVAPFCPPDDALQPVYFHPEAVGSHERLTEGAVHEVPGLIEGPCFSAKELANIEAVTKEIDFQSDPNAAYVFGENVRGKIMGCFRRKIVEEEDDIPF